MNDVSQILCAIQQGDAGAADQLLPLVYEELRILAASKLRNEKPGQTLQATALVHEAWLKLAGPQSQDFKSRQHFLGAAAEAMRRILVDQARRKLSVKHGGEWQRNSETIHDLEGPGASPQETVVINDLLEKLAEDHERQAEVAKMRLFLKMTFVEISHVLEMSPDTAESDWAYARAWLKRHVREE